MHIIYVGDTELIKTDQLRELDMIHVFVEAWFDSDGSGPDDVIIAIIDNYGTGATVNDVDQSYLEYRLVEAYKNAVAEHKMEEALWKWALKNEKY